MLQKLPQLNKGYVIQRTPGRQSEVKLRLRHDRQGLQLLCFNRLVDLQVLLIRASFGVVGLVLDCVLQLKDEAVLLSRNVL